ncbi:MAG: PAS domain-containing hybrid sensor histidine kinase/response regulator, partial [Isosphaeraceae bacterium]
AVIAVDLRGQVVFINPRACRLTGWPEAEAIGTALAEVLPRADARTGGSILPPSIEAIDRGVSVADAGPVVLVTRDGRRTPVEETTTSIVDASGQAVGIVIVLRDASSRQPSATEPRGSEGNPRTTATPIEAETRLRAFFDHDPNFAAVLDHAGRVVEANRLGLDGCGIRREEVVGRPFWECVWWNRSPEQARTIREGTLQAISGRPGRVEAAYSLADGSERTVDLTLAPVADPHGRVRFIAAAGTDITERRHAEEALRQSARRKDEFLAMLAHELRNPLAAVRNATQVLRLADVPPEHADWAKGIIDRQVRHLARLIDDLLDVSRITRGKVDLQRERLEASAILNAAVDAVRPLIEEKQQRLSVSFIPGTLWCEVDPTRLEQVLINLLSNATRFTDSGGQLRLSARHDGRDIHFVVEDTGVGIPPDQLTQMFELFAQGDRSPARTEGGLGIGLTLVKQIAEMHGGRATAHSEGPGHGSRFTVTLPAIPGPRTALPARSPDDPGSAYASTAGRPSRILIVDDNADTALGLARLLRFLGHEVRVAHDGPAAIDAVHQERPDFLLLDIGLPGMDGYQVASQLRSEPGMDSLIIIAITGYGQDEDRRRSRAAGFDHHLVKPVDYQTLVTLLSSSAAEPS